MAYMPTTNNTTSAGLPHVQVVYYKKRALDRLQKKFLFRKPCSHEGQPQGSGRTMQFFRYNNFAANTTQTPEGTVGTSLSMSSRLLGVTLSQYSSFISISDFQRDTAIDPQLQQAADLLGYQAGLSVDTITRNVFDLESAGTNQTPLATYLKVQDLRNSRHSLQGVDVQPIENGEYLAISHPFSTYDLVNDPAAGGYADIFKYNTDVKSSALVKYEDRGLVTHVAGCAVWESTNVKTGTSGSSTTYRTYVFGREGVACVDLEGRGPTNVVDPRTQNFKINIIKGTPSIADPEGVIGGMVSYNFIYAAVVLDGPAGIGGTYRYKTIDAVSSIG